MGLVDLIYSKSADAAPPSGDLDGLLFEGAGGTIAPKRSGKTRNRSVVCSAVDGAVYAVTEIVDAGAASRWPDAERLARVEEDKLIFFEDRLGSLPVLDPQFMRRELRGYEIQRVMRAWIAYRTAKRKRRLKVAA